MAHQKHIERFTSGPDIPRRMAEQREVPGRRKNGEEFPIEASISKVLTIGYGDDLVEVDRSAISQ
jgi:hypothetical protein